jgi:hypothetical protein
MDGRSHPVQPAIQPVCDDLGKLTHWLAIDHVDWFAGTTQA